MSASNVVPLNGNPPPAPVPWPQPSVWPMPPIMPGCCPPGGMDNLMKCYCDIQAAMQFISALMLDIINNNPAVAQAMIDAIVKSGSALPLVGVTNGSDAQVGQVGEWVLFQQDLTYPVGSSSQTVTMGILQPGDWDIWYSVSQDVAAPVGTSVDIAPRPVGLYGDAFSVEGRFGDANTSIPCRGLFSVPTLIPLLFIVTDNTAPMSLTVQLHARRRR